MQHKKIISHSEFLGMTNFCSTRVPTCVVTRLLFGYKEVIRLLSFRASRPWRSRPSCAS
jgi:hypothetical protein